MSRTPAATRLLVLASALVLVTGVAACSAPADTDDVRVAPISLDDRPTTPSADPDAGGAEPVMPPEPAPAGQPENDDVAARRDASPSPSPAPDDDSDLDDDRDDPDDDSDDSSDDSDD